MESLHTSLQGLSSEVAASLRASYGPNEVVREKKLAVFRQFIAQFKNPLIIILLLAAVLSVFLGEFVDAIIIIVIVFLSVCIDFFQEYRAERSVELLRKKISTLATVTRDGSSQDGTLNPAQLFRCSSTYSTQTRRHSIRQLWHIR
jgi:magnesium-transporting ATPase (P-type)